MQFEVLGTNMGKKRDLTDADRLKISSMLGYGKSTLEITKKYESRPSNYEEIYGFRSNHEENAKKMSFEEAFANKKLRWPRHPMQRLNKFLTTLASQKLRKQPDGKP